MATVTLSIGGRRYEMACRDGEQPHLEALGAMIDAKAIEAGRAVRGLTETRQLLLAALLLANELVDTRAAQGGGGDAVGQARRIEALALRIEAMAARLEKVGGSA